MATKPADAELLRIRKKAVEELDLNPAAWGYEKAAAL